MATVKKRNLFNEIRGGLEAYRDHRDTLPQRKLSASDVKVIREHFGTSQPDMAALLNVSKGMLEN